MRTKEKDHLYQKRWRDKNKPYNKLRMRKYRATHKKQISQWKKKRRSKNPEKFKRQSAESYIRNKQRCLAWIKADYKRKRLLCLNHYSNNDPKCSCCGEKHLEFLTFDHTNNDGAAHRKTLSKGKYSTGALLRWMIKNNFPSTIQILCMNCNCAKYRYGICPHQKEKEVI